MCISGFEDIHREFENDFTRAEFVGDPQQADGLIIDLDRVRFDTDRRYVSPTSDNVRWVAAIGSGKSVTRLRRQLDGGFLSVREYGLLPAGNPRVLVPLGNSRHTVLALDLHRPGRWAARFAVRLAGAAAHVGLFFPLRRQVLLIATRERYEWPLGAIQADLPAHVEGNDWDYALYLGTADENRKTTVLPLGTAAPDTLVKIGSSPEARMALKNEAAALTFLQGSPLREQVPRMKGLVENEHCMALYQEYRPRIRQNSQSMEPAVVDFLARLSAVDLRSRPLRDILTDWLAVNWDGKTDADRTAFAPVLRWLGAQADQGAQIWEHRSHGDFAPWNCSWTEGGLFVFDWEESRVHSPAFGDAFYCAVSPALHVERRPDPERTMRSALELATRVANRQTSAVNAVKLHFVLWVTLKWGEHPLYEAIIECLAREF